MSLSYELSPQSPGAVILEVSQAMLSLVCVCVFVPSTLRMLGKHSTLSAFPTHSVTLSLPIQRLTVIPGVDFVCVCCIGSESNNIFKN